MFRYHKELMPGTNGQTGIAGKIRVLSNNGQAWHTEKIKMIFSKDAVQTDGEMGKTISK